jgi:hypothetical protein
LKCSERSVEFLGGGLACFARCEQLWSEILMAANGDVMRGLEEEYRRVSGLKNRSEYKIFYGQVFPAPILTLGLNPGGTPEGTSQDGTRQKDGSRASSSASYFEQDENDILDCDWRENIGLRKLLLPLVGHDHNRFRSEIVKTNMAFRRSRAVSDIDLAVAEREAVPFIEAIIDRVSPRLIILTGPSIDRFLSLYALDSRPLTETIKAPGINHVVFAASAARLRSIDRETIVVQVAHASRFAWTYERYGVVTKISGLTGNAIGQRGSTESGVQRTSASIPTGLPTNTLSHQALETRVAQTERNPRLSELGSTWRDLGIGHQFPQVHHFARPEFVREPPGLDRFIRHCSKAYEIRDENAQTLERALNVARRMKDGQNFNEALEQAWATHPIITR